MLKELQSLGLDVRVLRDDNTEVEIMETVDMGETDFRSLIEGDRKYRQDEDESVANMDIPLRNSRVKNLWMLRNRRRMMTSMVTLRLNLTNCLTKSRKGCQYASK